MLSERVFPPAGECKEHLSGYDLTTLLIRNGKQLDLKPSELLVFTALATYWNGKPVFPRITTLSDNTNLSDKAVRNALNGLISKGYIIKSKRGKNANVYNININAVKSTVENGKSDRISTVKNTAPCMKLNHDKSNKQQPKKPDAEQKKSDVVVSLKKSFNQELPEQVKEYLTFKGIKNPAGYWNTALKGGYADDLQTKAKEHQEAEQRKERLRQEREQAELRERAEKQKMLQDISRPLTEQWTREQAIQTIYSMRKLIRHGHKGIAQDLADAFNLDIEKIINN